MNAVFLKDEETGVMVKCHATRSLQQNRKLARRWLQEKLDDVHLGPNAPSNLRKAKLQRRKAKMHRRAKEKASLFALDSQDEDDEMGGDVSAQHQHQHEQELREPSATRRSNDAADGWEMLPARSPQQQQHQQHDSSADGSRA